MNNNSNNNFTLNREYDILELDEVLDILHMKKRIQQAKTLHPYEIHYTEKSGFFTVVDDVTAPTGKKKIRKCSEEKLWDALAEWYLDNTNKNITLQQVYEKWLNWKTTPNNAENIKRIQASWKTYYLNEPLSRQLIQKPFTRITTLDLRTWAESLMKKYLPDKKKFSRMFTIINQCYEYASDEDIAIIHENHWQKARKKLNKSLIVSKPTASDESQVFTDEERRQIKAMVYEDLERYQQQSSSAGLQILFLFETGLRIGECCGLKWSDVKDNRLYIHRQATNEGVKNKTKTASSFRDIPLTKEAQRILEDVKAFNKEHGFTADWIFQSNNPDYDYRLSYNAADRKLRKLCNRLDTIMKSPHKCRKTCISILLDNPKINDRTVQRFAGHHALSTTQDFYSFERKSKEEQAEAIDKALAL
ncbi:MAG: site-specific integrase [Lachnospiraceae bacterium]|nr:site-specific integrase [Lachnospiraceae bacterium]